MANNSSEIDYAWAPMETIYKKIDIKTRV